MLLLKCVPKHRDKRKIWVENVLEVDKMKEKLVSHIVVILYSYTRTYAPVHMTSIEYIFHSSFMWIPCETIH